MLAAHDLQLAAELAVLAYVIAVILTQDGYLLCRYYDMLVKLKVKGFGWLAYPLGFCAKCLSGQLALWTWVYAADFDRVADWPLEILRLGVFIAVTILFTNLLEKILFRL